MFDEPRAAEYVHFAKSHRRVENFRHEGGHVFIQQTRMFISEIAACQRKKGTQ